MTTRGEPHAAAPEKEPAAVVASLRDAFLRGRTRQLAWRLEQLSRLEALIDENIPAFDEALRADLGKSPAESWMTDLGLVRKEIGVARTHLRRWMAPERVGTPLVLWPARSWIVREPLGVVLVIGAWNYPIQLCLMPLLSAVAAGNAVVVKPSEVCVQTSHALARLVERYLDPLGVAVIEGGVPETTRLLEQRFDHVFYTGNGAVGRIVMQAAARHLTPVTLELGGKSPCIVDEGVDPRVAGRRIAFGKFLNAGQTCIAPDYVLVHEAAEAGLLDGLRRALHEFYGEDPRASPDYARIVNERHFDRLSSLLAGGEVVAGGETDRVNRFIAPTILRNVAPDAPVMAEEIFGPILPVLRVPDMRRAVEFVNGRPRPLAMYLFTNRAEVEREVLAATSAGGTCINATLLHHVNPQLPFGGVGASGMGAYHGRHGFETFSHRRSVLSKPLRPDVPLAYPPYTSLKDRLLKRIL